MKRFVLLTVLAGALALPAFAAIEPQAQLQRPNAQAAQNQQQLDPQARLQNQMRVIISNFYSTKFREALELTDDQFIKTSFFIQQFIDQRFNAAMRRELVNKQLEQLQSQPNPSKEAIDELVVAQALLDNNVGNMQSQFLEKIRPELKTQQILAFLAFNKKFFGEDLRQVIEMAREAAPQGRQNQAAPRPNQNPAKQQNNPNRPANALRGNRQGQD